MEKSLSVIEKLDMSVTQVLGSENTLGFQKAHIVSKALVELKELLTPEYMKPIMALQGNRLGFKTDKDNAGGYDEKAVKNCVIEAVLMGVQVTGNQFNIIAGNSYITKEGFGYLLSKVKGLHYSIVFELPRIGEKSAAVIALVKFEMNGIKKEEKLDLPIKVNQYMGADAVIGKATRKARAWLYSQITGTEFGDGDLEETPEAIVIENKADQIDARKDKIREITKGKQAEITLP